MARAFHLIPMVWAVIVLVIGPESGENSPNDPHEPFSGGPHTQGYTNTIVPTAVSLASFSATTENANRSVIIVLGLLTAVTGWGWFYHNKK